MTVLQGRFFPIKADGHITKKGCTFAAKRAAKDSVKTENYRPAYFLQRCFAAQNTVKNFLPRKRFELNGK